LTSCGHGAAAWMTQRSEETPYLARTGSGSASRRRNCVGTMWLWVTRCRSIKASASSDSNLSISTTG